MANSINDNYSINELLVNKNYTNPEHLYIHIPFCKNVVLIVHFILLFMIITIHKGFIH